MKLNRGKVNAINHQMVKEIRSTFDELKNDPETRGVIITGAPHFFSAGLDVIELYGYDEEKIREFFIDFGSMYAELAKFPKAFVCAVTGHSPAGGTVIAITADYRVMVDDSKYTIGLNEMAVSVQISQKLIDGYSYWLGKGQANEYVLEGKLLTPAEALESGLGNEVCALEEVMEKAENKMKHYLKADPDIFLNTKAKLRKSFINENGEHELQEALSVWWKPEVRVRMKGLIDSISKK